MENKKNDKFEQDIRFIARYYKEGKLDAGKAWNTFAAQKGIRRVVSFRRIIVGVAAVILLLIGFRGWYLWQKRPDWVILTAEKGTIKNVTLPDQSQLTLAGGAEVKYDAKVFSKQNREISLAGKVWFDIKRNENLPFIITSDLSRVIVLGTSFELWDKGDEVSIHVFSGKVSFMAEDKEEVLLTENMSAYYRKEYESIEIDSEENPNQLSWKNGRLIFNNTPLEKVIKDINQHYGVQVKNYYGEENQGLTATFNQMPIEEVLLIINQTLDVQLMPD